MKTALNAIRYRKYLRRAIRPTLALILFALSVQASYAEECETVTTRPAYSVAPKKKIHRPAKLRPVGHVKRVKHRKPNKMIAAIRTVTKYDCSTPGLIVGLPSVPSINYGEPEKYPFGLEPHWFPAPAQPHYYLSRKRSTLDEPVDLPEPAGIALVGLGLGMMCFARRKG